jgi:hypothetical protein
MAIEKLNALLHSKKQSELVVAKTANVSKNFVDLVDFIAFYKTRNKYLDLAKKTKQLYDMYLRLYVIPDLGEVLLEDIDADTLEEFEISLRDRELSPKTIKNAFGFLKSLLNFAVRRNFMKFVPQYSVSIKG